MQRPFWPVTALGGDAAGAQPKLHAVVANPFTGPERRRLIERTEELLGRKLAGLIEKHRNDQHEYPHRLIELHLRLLRAEDNAATRWPMTPQLSRALRSPAYWMNSTSGGLIRSGPNTSVVSMKPGSTYTPRPLFALQTHSVLTIPRRSLFPPAAQLRPKAARRPLTCEWWSRQAPREPLPEVVGNLRVGPGELG